MTVHTEWMSATHVTFEFLKPGEYDDAYGQHNDQPALVISADSDLVIEGTIPELRNMLGLALAKLPTQ